MSRSFSAFSTTIPVVIAALSHFVVQDTLSKSWGVYVRGTGQGRHHTAFDLAWILYKGPKPCQCAIVLKSRYIAQHLFQYQVQLHIMDDITSGLINIGKKSNDARKCVLDVSSKAGPLFLIRFEFHNKFGNV